MKDRIISAGIIIVIFFLFAAFSHHVLVLRLLTLLLSVLSLAEIFVTSKWETKKTMLILPTVSAITIPLLPAPHENALYLGLFAAGFVLITILVAWISKASFRHAVTVALISLLIPFFYSSITYLRILETGHAWFYAVFVSAWGSDTGGYIFGHLFGKHKLIPRVSPNKTVEGFVGGIVTSVIGLCIVGFFAQFMAGHTVNYLSLAICGLLGSLASVGGDLSASSVKRHLGLKDFGDLIPGHGGIMDRFDSILFCTPVFYGLHFLFTLFTTLFETNWTVFGV